MLEQIDPVIFCKAMIQENTPEEFAYIIFQMINSGDSEDFALAVQLIFMSASLNQSYSMLAYIAFKNLMNHKEV